MIQSTINKRISPLTGIRFASRSRLVIKVNCTTTQLIYIIYTMAILLCCMLFLHLLQLKMQGGIMIINVKKCPLQGISKVGQGRRVEGQN